MHSAASAGNKVTESSTPATASLLRAPTPGTDWRCADDHHTWHRGHGYRQPHGGGPKRLILAVRETRVGESKVVCE